jgi:hypothetical protein
MAPSKLRLAAASMNQPETRIGDLCAEFGITLRMRRSIRPTRASGTTQLTCRGGTGNDASRRTYLPPRSGAAPGSACLQSVGSRSRSRAAATNALYSGWKISTNCFWRRMCRFHSARSSA